MKFLIFCLLFPAVAYMESFQFNQDQVSAYHESQSSPLEQLIQMLEGPFLQNAKQILDLGCGDGKITALLAKKLPSSMIVGCDVSEEMILFANRQYPSQEYPNLRFIEKDACNLNFYQQFDRIISINCLHWIQNQQRALEEMRASLIPGGLALIVASPKSSHDDLQDLCPKIMYSSKWAAYFQDFKGVHSFYTQEEYRQMLTKANFSIVKMQERVREVVFDDKKSFEKFLKAVLTPMFHLPEENRQSFMADLFDAMQKKGCIDSSGKIYLHFGQIEMLINRSTSG